MERETNEEVLSMFEKRRKLLNQNQKTIEERKRREKGTGY